MYCHYIIGIDKQHISEEDTSLWLFRGNLKGETASEIIAAQDQALQTKTSCNKNITNRTRQQMQIMSTI
jgi:hypothetical protein